MLSETKIDLSVKTKLNERQFFVSCNCQKLKAEQLHQKIFQLPQQLLGSQTFKPFENLILINCCVLNNN